MSTLLEEIGEDLKQVLRRTNEGHTHDKKRTDDIENDVPIDEEHFIGIISEFPDEI